MLFAKDLAVDDRCHAHAFDLCQAQRAIDVGHDGLALWLLAGLKEFFHARQTAGDVTCSLSRTTSVEGSQSQLRARLTDGLRRDDADCRTDLDQFSTSKVAPVT